MSIDFTPKENHAVIQLAGSLTQAEALEFRRSIHESAEYWHFKELVFELDSPGGELQALRAVTHELKWWRSRGGSVKTLALGVAGSAAAIALALGNVGQRVSLPHSVLLFHHSRLMTDGGQLTALNAVSAAVQLQVVDRMLLNQLVEHISDGFGGAQALAHAGLTRCKHLIARASEIADQMGPSAGVCRKPERGHRATVAAQLKGLVRAFEDVGRKGVVTPFVELLAKEFERDQPMFVDFAWAVLLIDQVDSVALLKPLQAEGMTPSPTQKLRLAA